MNIIKEDIELFCILKNEIDKTYTDGCFFYYKGKMYKNIHFNYSYQLDGTMLYKWIFPFFRPFKKVEINLDKLYSRNYPKNGILGHYPTTNNLLMFLLKKGCNIERQQTICFLNITRYGKKIFELDISKEIKDYKKHEKMSLIFNLNELEK